MDNNFWGIPYNDELKMGLEIVRFLKIRNTPLGRTWGKGGRWEGLMRDEENKVVGVKSTVGGTGRKILFLEKFTGFQTEEYLTNGSIKFMRNLCK